MGSIALLDVIAVCQRVNASVSGVVTAPVKIRDYPTGEIAAASMPLVMTLPDSAISEYKSVGGKYVREQRQYKIKVLAAARESGIGGEKIADTIALLDRMLAKWFTLTHEAMTTDNLEMVYTNVRDTGYKSDIDHAGRKYHGFEITVMLDRVTV